MTKLLLAFASESWKSEVYSDDKCGFLYFDPGSIKNRFLDSLRPLSEIRAQFPVCDQASARVCFQKLKIRSLCDEKCGFLYFDPGSIKNRFLDSLRPVSEIRAQFPVCDQASARFCFRKLKIRSLCDDKCGFFVFWPWVNQKPVSGLVKTG